MTPRPKFEPRTSRIQVKKIIVSAKLTSKIFCNHNFPKEYECTIIKEFHAYLQIKISSRENVLQWCFNSENSVLQLHIYNICNKKGVEDQNYWNPEYFLIYHNMRYTDRLYIFPSCFHCAQILMVKWHITLRKRYTELKLPMIATGVRHHYRHRCRHAQPCTP